MQVSEQKEGLLKILIQMTLLKNSAWKGISLIHITCSGQQLNDILKFKYIILLELPFYSVE
jgi:hypothetical protein